MLIDHLNRQLREREAQALRRQRRIAESPCAPHQRVSVGDAPARELLAVAANLVGKLVAMQDQRTMTPAEAMEIVAMNIEHGNKQVLDQLAASRGSV